MRERPALFQRLKPRELKTEMEPPQFPVKLNHETEMSITSPASDGRSLLNAPAPPPIQPLSQPSMQMSLPAKVVGQLKDASQDIIDLVNARVGLLKMDVVDIASQAIVITVFSIVALLGTAFMFIAGALVLGEALQNTALGFLIVGAFMLGIGCAAVWFKRDVSAAFVRDMIDNLINKTT